MNRHQKSGDKWQSDAVQNVEPKQCAFSDEAAAQKAETRITGACYKADVAQFQQRGTRSFRSGEWSCTSHIASYRNSPDRKLIPRQQISGEAQQQRQYKKNDTNVPVELAGRFIGPRHEDAEHV